MTKPKNIFEYTPEKSLAIATYFSLREITRRGKFEEWRTNAYSPSDDPTYPKVLLESKHSKEWFNRALEYDNNETVKFIASHDQTLET